MEETGLAVSKAGVDGAGAARSDEAKTDEIDSDGLGNKDFDGLENKPSVG